MGSADRSIILASVVIGAFAAVIQLVVIREFLNVFLGNELVYGIVLSSWLALVGLGGYLGRFLASERHRERFFLISLIGLSALAMLTVVLIRGVRGLLFVRGEIISASLCYFISLGILAPYCLLAGMMFTLASIIVSDGQGAEQISWVYAAEGIGSVIGGCVFTLLVIFRVLHMRIVWLCMLCSISVSVILSSRSGHRGIRSLGVIALAIVCASGLLLAAAHSLTIDMMYQNQQVLDEMETPYGRIVLASQDGQINVFQNGLLLFSGGADARTEEAVHYAMLQARRPERVLIVGGGPSGAIEEALKYDGVLVDAVDLDWDAAALRLGWSNAQGNPRVRHIRADPRGFVRDADVRYDAVIISMPNPDSASVNRVYTIEMMEDIHRLLKTGGVLSLTLDTGGEYIGSCGRELNSIMHGTLSSIFQNVLLLPGASNHLLASDGPLTSDIARRMDGVGILTRYASPGYLAGELSEDRIEYLRESVSADAPLNRDLMPVAYFAGIREFLDISGWSLFWALPLCIMLSCMAIGLRSVWQVLVFASGFCACANQVMLVFLFQAVYGYAYLAIGMIYAMFMAGLAFGAWFASRHVRKDRICLIRALLCLVAYPVLIPILGPVSSVFVFILSGGCGMLSGLTFSLVAHLDFKGVSTTSSLIYMFDLLGSCMGALIVSTVLLPNLGIAWLSICISFLMACACICATMG